MVSTTKLLKTFAYAAIAICSLTSFGRLSEVCSRGLVPGTNLFSSTTCPGRVAAAITFGVLATLASLAMLVLHFVASELADKIDIIGAHVLLLFVVIGLGTSAYMLTLASLANFTATIIVTLLCVYSWHNLPFSFAKKSDSPQPEPSVTTEVPPSMTSAQVPV